MKKIFSILLLIILTSFNIQSAGKFRLGEISNESSTKFKTWIYFAKRDIYGSCEIQPGASRKFDDVTIKKKSKFELSIIKLPEGSSSELLWLIIDANGGIKLFLGDIQQDEILSDSIDLNYDYSVNLVTKSDFKFEIAVVQE